MSDKISRRPLSDTKRNANVMATSSSTKARNPGGHNGRSGQNGAGNHRKTPEEKAISEAARAEVEAARAARQRQERRLAQAEKHRHKFRKLLSSQRVSVVGRNMKRLTASDFMSLMDTAFHLRCSEGHDFYATPKEIINSQAKYLCPFCRSNAKSQPRADARLKFYMRCDEQGLDVVEFTNMTQACTVVSRVSGESYKFWPQNVGRWGCVPQSNRRIRFVADDHDRVFVFRGPKPAVKHPYIAKMLSENPVEEWEENLKSAADMERFIRTLQQEGDRVVNLSMNTTWVSNDEYTWGHVPTNLGEFDAYIAGLQKGW